MADGFDIVSVGIGAGAALAGSVVTAFLHYHLEERRRAREEWRASRRELLDESRKVLLDYESFHDDEDRTGEEPHSAEFEKMEKALERAFGPGFAKEAIDALRTRWSEDPTPRRGACILRMRQRIREIERELGIPERVPLDPPRNPPATAAE